ncbi:MAG: hypothetical protein AVDCRST_MAG19-4819, partial [uncultured Thermomicrobiales bacterium]
EPPLRPDQGPRRPRLPVGCDPPRGASCPRLGSAHDQTADGRRGRHARLQPPHPLRARSQKGPANARPPRARRRRWRPLLRRPHAPPGGGRLGGRCADRLRPLRDRRGPRHPDAAARPSRL